MRESKTVLIDDVSYLIMPCSPMKAQKILVKITKTLGKPIAGFILELLKNDPEKLLDSELKALGSGEKNIESIANAFIEFSYDADEVKIEDLTIAILSIDHVKPDGKRMITIDSHFNNYGLLHMYKVIWEVLKVNFSDFLVAATGRVS